MRKIYLILVACFLCAISASAALYITGSVVGGWAPHNPKEFTDHGNGLYSYTLSNALNTQQPGKISTAKGNQDGDWSTFNGGVKSPKDNNNPTLGTTYQIGNSNADVNFPAGTKQIVVDLTKDEFTCYDKEQEFGFTLPTLYLRGKNVGDWSAVDRYKFTTPTDKNAEGFYEYTLALDNLSDEFKVADKDWGTYNYGATGADKCEFTTTLTKYEVAYNSGTNFKIAGGATLNNVTVTFFLNSDTNGKHYLQVAPEVVMETVATPVISQDGNNVSIACTTAGATVKYGFSATALDNVYTAPFAITANTTVYAVATKDGMKNSEMATKDVTYTAPVTGDETVLYLHLKNDWKTYGKAASKPRAMVVDNGSKTTFTATEGKEMALVNEEHQVWAATFTAAEMEGKNDVLFGFLDENNNYRVYRGLDNSKDEDYTPDAENWTKFIYSTQQADGHYYAAQTYYSYSDYEALWNAPKTALYFTGNINGSSYDLTKCVVCYNEGNPAKGEAAVNVVNEPNLFYFNLKEAQLQTGNNAKFKLSWLNPTGGNENASRRRMWATFDLGVIGVDQKSGDYQVESDGNGEIGHVTMNMYESISVDYLNQFDWFVSEYHADENQYVVVDLDPDFQTLTLVGFRPNPTVTDAKINDITQVNLDQPLRPELNGSAHTGHVMFDRANTVSGEITIKATAPDDFKEHFSMKYYPWMNGSVLGEYDVTGAVPTGFKLDNMAPDFDGTNDLGIRAVYTSNKSGKSFRSRIAHTELEYHGVNLGSPTVSNVSKGTYLAHGNDCWGLGMTLKATAPSAGDMIMYTDFAIDKSLSHDHEYSMLVNKDHWLAGVSFFTEHAQWSSWDGQNEADYNNETHNWSNKITSTEGATLPIYIHNVAPRYLDMTAEEEVKKLGEQERSFTGNVYAVYPFVVNPSATPEPIFAGGGDDPTPPTPSKNYIYFDNSTTGWDEVSVYCWTDGAGNNTWPGVKAESMGNNMYRLDVTDIDYKNVIFNNNNKGDQTMDLTLVKDNVYTPVAPSSHTVYFDNTKNWPIVKIHYWGGSNETSWPGNEMTKVTDNIWQYTVPADTPNIIFNNGGSGNNNQTGRYEPVGGRIYEHGKAEGYTGGKLFVTYAPKASAPRRVVAVGADSGNVIYPSVVASVPFNLTMAAGANVDTGVADINVDGGDTEAVLYTLQGVRVSGTPAPGLYISRKGNTATKVLVK